MHNRPAARREVAGPKRARRAVNEIGTVVMVIVIMAIATRQNRVVEMTDEGSMAPHRIIRAVVNRVIATTEAGPQAGQKRDLALRDHTIVRPIAIEKQIALPAPRAKALIEVIWRAAAGQAHLLVAPDLNAGGAPHRPQ